MCETRFCLLVLLLNTLQTCNAECATTDCVQHPAACWGFGAAASERACC